MRSEGRAHRQYRSGLSVPRRRLFLFLFFCRDSFRGNQSTGSVFKRFGHSRGEISLTERT